MQEGAKVVGVSGGKRAEEGRRGDGGGKRAEGRFDPHTSHALRGGD